jgi:hypothetical protein
MSLTGIVLPYNTSKEAFMTEPRNEYYISSGAKNAQFTLRIRFEEWMGVCGEESGMRTRDQYVCNLGTDIEYAKEKAAKIAGVPVFYEELKLNAYGYKTPEELAAEALREKMISEREGVQIRLDAEAAEKARLRREEDAKSQWQGVVGGRITRDLTCLRWIPTYEGAYGMRYVAIFRDAEMNKYVFFGAAAGSLPNEGYTGQVSFEVSSHGERDGCKQTIIKRPKAIKAKVAA